jgi:hypothetical protein
VHDAPLVGIQRAHLLIHPRLLHLAGEELRHVPHLDVLALAVLKRVDEHALLAIERPPVGHVNDVLQRLERLAAVPHEQLGVLAGQVEARPIGRFLDVNGRRDPERSGHAVQKIDDGGCGGHRLGTLVVARGGGGGLAPADALHPALAG